MLSKRDVISVRGLGKSYRIQHERPQSTLAEEFLRRLRDPFASPAAETFWALKDVSFDIAQGDIIGLIGRNGAGKSTLLKILGRITSPTTGEARIAGRIGSLIEVGTGFHLELTGRENIFLNGAILGMRRHEIARRFDEIVDFAGVEKFLDTPVKRYSSGMFVRLAFAVAAHLDTDILLVDEVLSVGDAEFQKKCLGKLGTVAHSGRTVLFVSHNLASLEALCNRGLLFEGGTLKRAGSLREALEEYRNSLVPPGNEAATEGAQYVGDRYNLLQSIDIVDEAGASTRNIAMGTTLRVRIRIRADEPIEYPTLAVKVDGIMGQRMLITKSPTTGAAIPRLHGPCEVVCEIPALPFAPGEYTLRVGLAKGGVYLEQIDKGLIFNVLNADTFGDGWGAHGIGLCVAPSQWHLINLPDAGAHKVTSIASAP